MTRPKTIAVDFDGTLHDYSKPYPAIGKPNLYVIGRAIAARNGGAKLILWTCREGEALQAAVDWCRERGLEFDAINDNLPELKALYGNNPRKVAADEYWDDKNVMVV